MAFKFNPATGKFEVVPAQGKGQPNPATAKTPTANLPQATRVATQTRPQRIAPASNVGPQPPAQPPRAAAGPPSPITGQYPSVVKPVQPVAPTPDGQTIIQSMWDGLYAEAATYRTIYGEEPPASWWSARISPIEAAQKRLDASVKPSGDGGKAAADAAAKAKKEEIERIRNVKGGREGEAFLREQAVTRKEEMLKRVADLYDPQKTKTDDDLKAVLKSASEAFDLAEEQVSGAQTNFEQQFRPSTAYEGVPISTFNVADNPLLAALQSQGAGTGEVQAATDLARQTAQSTSDLEKYALSQLNIGQQNYGSAQQNAALMGTMAGLQQLGGRRADVKSGIEQQFADALAKIGAEQTGAESKVDETIADIISKADEMRADTTAKYGNLPSETKKPEEKKPEEKKPVAKKPAVVKPKTVTPVVTPVVKPTNIKRNVR
jgi:hypothetical protein